MITINYINHKGEKDRYKFLSLEAAEAFKLLYSKQIAKYEELARNEKGKY